MAEGDRPLAAQARDIFEDLGYAVADDGHSFVASRDWKRVRVEPVVGNLDPGTGERLTCYVARSEEATALAPAVRAADPEGEWALVAVDSDGGYEVLRAP